MSAVMMILTDVPITRVPGKVGTPRKSRVDGRNRPARDERDSRGGDRKRDDRKREGFGGEGSSPWRTVSRAPGDEAPVKADHGGISGKSFIDPEVLRRQRAEETRVYGENACRALFQSRPDAIVRAWFIQSVTPRFKEALRWMAANRKAYHVVDEAELAKASGTEHHGGVCFLIKNVMAPLLSSGWRKPTLKIACWRWKMSATRTTLAPSCAAARTSALRA